MKDVIKSPFRSVISYFGERKLNQYFKEPPVIVGGCARSGTTLLLSILSAHPRLFVFPRESAAFSKWHKDRSGHMVPSRIDKLYRELLKQKIPETATRWCSKAPSNVRHIKEIMDYFNNEVKFIHIIRDVRDVMLSKHPKDPSQYYVSPERWLNDVKSGLAFKNHPNVLTLKYEDLIQHFDPTLRTLCHFIDIPVVSEIMEWNTYKTLDQSKAIFGQIQDVYQSSIGKWQRDESGKAYIERVLANKQEILSILGHLNYL